MAGSKARGTVNPELPVVDPLLSEAWPPGRTVIIGANGQLGRALRSLLPDVEAVGRDRLDLADPRAVETFPWAGVGTIINAAAFTSADAAESLEGRREAWAVNVAGVAALARVAAVHEAVLMHVSSDYVFDGAVEVHTEDEPFSPLGVYGQTKAAGDTLVAQLTRHYVVRTSWVIGAGHNFVRTMAGLAKRGVTPQVVDDQFGRLTFTEDLAGAIVHLLATGSPYGTYNVSNAGPVQAWCDIARDVFELCGRAREDVKAVSTEVYALGKQFSPRPRNSAMSLDKIAAAGFVPPPAAERLRANIAAQGGGAPTPVTEAMR